MSPTARLGAFMVVALVILGIFIIKIEEIPLGTRGGRQRVQVIFPSVAGLDEKSAVRIAGVRVGIVEKIALKNDEALVTLSLESDVRLHEGARAEIASLGMLGDKYIELFPGPLTNPPLPPGTLLQGTSPVGFDQLLKTVNDVGGDLKSVTGSLRQALGGPAGEHRLDEILENVRLLSADVRTLVEANRQNVDATLTNFRDFSETLRVELPKLADKLNALATHVDQVVEQNRGNIDASLANIKDLSARLKTSADNLNIITGKIARGEGSIGKLVNDDTTVNNLNDTLKSVESGVQTLKDTIGRVQRWQVDLNLRTESLPQLTGHASRSTFGLDLHTTPKRFYRIELVDSPFGRTHDTTNVVTTTYPDGHTETLTQAIQEQTDTNTINAQVGYLLPYDFTVRAGLFESKGGVGMDKALLDKKLLLTLDAYDFSRDVKPPHLRIEGRYFLTQNIFAYTGLDDPTWALHRSYLVGAGITWNDEDIKYLLGSVASALRP